MSTRIIEYNISVSSFIWAIKKHVRIYKILIFVKKKEWLNLKILTWFRSSKVQLHRAVAWFRRNIVWRKLWSYRSLKFSFWTQFCTGTFYIIMWTKHWKNCLLDDVSCSSFPWRMRSEDRHTFSNEDLLVWKILILSEGKI